MTDKNECGTNVRLNDWLGGNAGRGNMFFQQLKFTPRWSGTQAEIRFPNGYGASVITGAMFYTSEDKPYELAVLAGDELTYDTPVTSDVLGWLTEEWVEDALRQIAELPPLTPNAGLSGA